MEMHHVLSTRLPKGNVIELRKRNRNQNRNVEARAQREWGLECSPQVPPYEPSKNHREIKAVKGRKIRDRSQKA